MGFEAGSLVKGRRVDVAFIGSCTNARLSDLRAAANVVRGQRLARHVRGLVVPGSRDVQRAAEREGLHEVFAMAGFEWREPGCSLCLGMNDDKLSGAETCASSSNRNFRGRQGSPTGRTLLMSPADGRRGRHRRRSRGRAQPDAARRSRAMSGSRIALDHGPRPAAGRRRHRHRPDHAGPPPARDHLRWARAAPVRGRPRPLGGPGGRCIPSTTPASPVRR